MALVGHMASPQEVYMKIPEQQKLNRKPLVVLVGDSKAGKTTLSVGLLAIWSDRANPLAYVRTLTSRARRPDDPTEDVVYDFTDRARILRLRREGKLVEFVNYGGNLYAVSQQELDRVLSAGLGIIAATEGGLADFQKALENVVPIKILAEDQSGAPPVTDALRRAQDKERAGEFQDYQAYIVNSFAPGGKARALADLQMSVINHLYPPR